MLSHAPWRTHATPARSGDASGGRRLPWRVPAVATARQHWLLSALLAAGVALRVLAVAAYHPALIYVDTLKYLYGAYPGAEPLGYTVVLKVILLAGDLGTVAVIQHLLGLAMALTVYAVLLRRGVARWLAAVAAAPVLLDAYQLQMEQTIMPDAWFEAMIVAGLAVLLWRPAVTMRFAVAAGLILGSAATIQQLGEVPIRPAAGYPACPDHTEKRTLFALLDVTARTGVTLTESYAMLPASSVAGWYIGHPEAFYFGLGKIGRDQVEDYAARKGMSVGEVERWLAPNLGYGND